jgi:hypothetical protein
MTYTSPAWAPSSPSTVEDYYRRKSPGGLRLNEKNGKLHAMPCHLKLEDNQDAYMACAAIARACSAAPSS